MSYRPSRRLIATLRALTNLNNKQNATRQLLAFFIAALILFQPMVLAVHYSNPFVAAASPFVSSTLVINEIDYDQVGTDTGEYVELKNVSAGPINLSGYDVVMVNGTGGGAAIYDTIVLPNVNLAAGDYFVICANAANVINCDLDDGPDTDFIQNGSPDAVAVRLSGTIIDTVSYEGNTGAPYTETAGTPVATGSDSTTVGFIGLSRLPDGADTDNNANDATIRCITPGTVNVSAATGCTAPVAAPNLTINDVTANETNGGTTTFNFTVSLSAPAGAGGVTFDIATADGTAQDDNPGTEDSDYVAKSLTGQTIVAGNSSYNFDVTVNGDADIEPNETFFVNITNITGAIGTDTQGLGTITNDDNAPPTNPSGTGAANPSTVGTGGSTVLTVTVTPGANPTSTGITVSGDLTSIGGSGTQSFSDDGLTGGDVTTGDNIFTYTATVPLGTTPGPKSLPISIGDAQARTGSTSIALTVIAGCGETYTPIYTIQGSGASTPIPGTATTEGVVVGDFQGSTGLSGFYLQDPTGDANTATSDGIFVFDGGTPAVAVSVGDRLRVSGTVAEAFTNTQITPTSVLICSTGNTLPAATIYDLPEPVNDDLERVENMLVTFPETLTVTGNFTWGRFGELVLSSDGRMFQQNSFDRPNTAGALARANLNARAYIVLDDGSSVQNPNPIPYQSPDNTRRAGDTVTGLTGILTFDFSQYRLQPTGTVTFAQANPRPATPASVGGNLKVASANVLNYFNGDGAGGGFPTARGASTLTEFNRQRAKVIAEIIAVNADVIGISEMENDGGGATSALQDLVNGLNSATAPGTYVGLHGPNPGTDLIQNAIIYKPASVTTVGAQVNDIDPAWGQARAPLAQTFQHNGNSERFTFIVNHFTSKGCSASDTGIDADMGDGQGCDNGQRQLQANRLLVFIQDRKTSSGDPDVLSVGDYNAYGEEDPLFILEQDASDTLADGAGGLVNQSKHFLPMADRYSFQFGNQFGELDHAYATKSMNFQVSGATIFHVNADEPVAIDYNEEFKTQDLYTPTPFRAADHDPLVVGLNLTATPPQAAGSLIISEFRFRGPGGSQDEFVELYNNTNAPITVATTDGSAGWTVVASNGSEVCRVNNTTVIPARGHFLCTNINYSLTNYGGPGGALLDTGFNPVDIPDGAGIALFRTNNAANYTLAERLDAVGYASVGSLYREGAGFQTGAPGNEIGGNIEYSFLRTMTRASGGLPKDTGDNVADFMGVATNGQVTSIGQNLGAPGPENLASPTNRNAQFGSALLDPAVSSASPPNRVRELTPHGCNGGMAPSNCTSGTMSVRRTFTNNTGAPVTRLRFRIVEVTTFPVPAMSGQADLRALTVGNTTATVTGVGVVQVRGTTLEDPPTQASGGGWNSTLNVSTVDGGGGMAGSFDLNAPLNVGESINVQFLLGVQVPGRFFFFLNIEADNGCVSLPAAAPCPVNTTPNKPLIRNGRGPR